MLSEMELNRLLNRGVSEIIVRKDMEDALQAGKLLRLKEGFDPSSPDIHLGHMVALRKLKQFQEYGHKIILIVADWTAQIGDPTGVSLTRPMLTREKVLENAKTYMEQFFKIVDKSKTEVRWQSDWFGKFDLSDVIKLTSKFTVAQFLAREDFSRRFSENRPIVLTEFLYPLLQAYDSVAVESDVEFGGTDQKFNFLVARELQIMMGQKPQQCFMTPLLVGTDGSVKMSKSLGNYIGVAESPENMYGKIMSINDTLIIKYFELLTDVPDNELKELENQLANQSINPMNLKKRLAQEIISQLHGKEASVQAEQYFSKVCQSREIPDEIPEVHIALSSFSSGSGVDLSRLLVASGSVKSRGEANRLIEQGGVDVDNNKITNSMCKIVNGSVVKIGKRRFIKVIDTEA